MGCRHWVVLGHGQRPQGAGTGPARSSRIVLSCSANTSQSSQSSRCKLLTRTVVVIGRRVRQKAGSWGLGDG